MNSAPWWVTTLVSGLPAVAAIASAFLAGRFAKRARGAEIEAQRLRDLEARLAEKKYETYKPMIAMLGSAFLAANAKKNPADVVSAEKVSEFAQWISIFGSDDAVRAYRNFMQSAYNDPPAEISMRVYADFVLAARRDMGSPSSELTALEILGMRLTDLHSNPKFYDIASMPFEELCSRYHWQPPWLIRRGDMDDPAQALAEQ
jgi:hypothetical protein